MEDLPCITYSVSFILCLYQLITSSESSLLVFDEEANDRPIEDTEWQGNIAELPCGTVKLRGPSIIIGGGSSEVDEAIDIVAADIADPMGLIAQQTHSPV
jgi:hypothetical protein